MAKLMQQAYKDGQQHGKAKIIFGSIDEYKAEILKTGFYDIFDEQEKEFSYMPKDETQSDWGYRVYIED